MFALTAHRNAATSPRLEGRAHPIDAVEAPRTGTTSSLRSSRWLGGIVLLLGLAGACGTPGATDGTTDGTGDGPSDAELTAQVQAAIEGSPTPPAATLAELRRVRPVLKCVEKTGTNTYSAHFGYTNSSSASISIPIGFFNRFFPSPINGGQPTVFSPGTQPDVVRVPFNRTGAVAWILGVSFDIATSRSRACPIVTGTGGAGGTGGATGGAGGVGGIVGTGGSGTGGQGQCPSNCDDHNPCTIDICNATTGFACSNLPARDGTICSDGNACTTADTCTAGVCVPGLPTVCQALDQCHSPGVCNPATGVCSMPTVADGTGCSDGNACTVGDVCMAGVCQQGSPVLCNAPDRCHSVGVCDPATGICANSAVANGTSCADTNACNGAETCQNGICMAGTPLSCQTTNPCQVGSCDAVAGCVLGNLANGTSCFSVGACGGGTCQAGVCVSTAATCDDLNPCTTDSCGPGGGCIHTLLADGASCSDGNPCNGVEICQSGFCNSGTAVVCVPSDQCHAKGFCVPATGACTNPLKANGSDCSDGNGCTTADTCNNGVCVSGAPRQCPGPSDQCHAAGTCDPSTGACSNPPVADFSPCSDGNACTSGDVCRSGVCAPGTPLTCTALDQCHVPGVCNPASGACSNPKISEGTPCSDGNTCTQADVCVQGTCQPGAPIACTASDQCHVAGSCDQSTGLCLNPTVPNGTTCSDGNACTVADSCQSGICASGNAVTCVAQDQCHTTGTCNPSSGVCSNPAKADGSSCNDGTACTQTDTCVNGACSGSSPVVCTAPDPCHSSSCDAVTGACVTVAVANGTPCSDGDGCTQGDTCQSGACTGTAVVCASPDGCHPGVCDHATGACSSPLACHLYGVGTIPSSATDGLSVSPKILEDETPHNLVGGLGSAIAYTGVGNLYVATPDRGPNNGLDSYTDRYYLIELTLSGGTVTANLRGGATLNQAPGLPFTGLSSAFDPTNSPASLRLDPEGIRVTPNGTMFVSDEYGPFLYEFGPDGNRIRSLTLPSKFLIDHPFADGTLELPPGNTKGRQSNRGMEGLAITPDGSRLFGMMQSPLIQDGALNASNSRIGTNVRILEYDLATNQTFEFLYQMDSKSYGVSEIVAVNDHQFLVDERDGNGGVAAAFKRFMLIDVTGATDISGVASLPSTGTPAGITPVSKKPFLDLLDSAYGLAGANFPEKVEGIAFGPDLPDGRHVVVITNDNDFLSTNGNNFYVFTIDPVALPGFQAQPATFPTACVIPAPVTCPAANECQLDGMCRPDNGACGVRVVAAGTASSSQVAGDCHQNQCNAGGQVVTVVDNTDVPVDGNPCTSDVCSGGVPSNPAAPAGTACSQGGGVVCNGAGTCVQCLAATDCPGADTACSFRTCTAGACGISFVTAGTPVAAQTAGDCHQNLCDGSGNVVSAVDDTDPSDDGNACTNDVCVGGVLSHPVAPANTPCSAGVCDASGVCVGCTVAAQCPGTDTFCGVRTCTAGVCGFAGTVAGTPLPTQTPGDCKVQTCDGLGGVTFTVDDTDLPIDANACTNDVCVGGVASNPAAAYGTTCGTNLICNGSGTCGPLTFRVVRMGDGAAALSSAGTAVFVEERRVFDGSIVGAPIAVSALAPGGLFSDSGTATSDGNLALSTDGRYLSLTGYAAAVGTVGVAATASGTTNRVVARIDAAGNVDTSTHFNAAFSANNIRMAVSIDGSAFWAGGAGSAVQGAWYIPFGTTGGVQLTALNTRTLGIFGNQLYGGSSSGANLGVYTIGSPPPPTSGIQVATNLPGQTSASSYDFVLFDRTSEPGLDTLYVADDSLVAGNTGGGIQKWVKSSGTWTRVSTFAATTTTGFRGLTGQISGSNVLLIATGAETTAERIVVFVDDGSPTITGTPLVSSSTNMIFRGVAFSPHN
jgi:hypothetical protein